MIKTICKMLFVATILSYCPFLSFSQNVGIGTVTPVNAKLQVEGPTSLTQAIFGPAGQPNVSIDVANPFIGFNNYYNGGRKAAAPGYSANMGFDPNSGKLSFNTSSVKYASAGSTISLLNAITIDSNQNVGIGTASPTLARLQIQGGVGDNMLVARTSAASTGFSLSNVGNYPTLGFNTEVSNGYRRMYQGYASFFQFDAASGDNKYWLSTDNAAAGTTFGYTQPFTLQGTGNVRINNYLGINANGNLDSGRVIIAHNSTIASPTLKLLETSTTDYARFELSNTATNRFWHIAGFNSTNGAAADRLNIYHSTAGDIISITGDGRVGIGTTNPATGYKVSVNGKVICTELRVQTVGAWPDYVFANTYKLRSLPELETFIQTNNHLPGVPAAAEVEANGITIGDMQKRLMEKVEELTLYIIQQDKRIKAQDIRIKHLERKK